MMTRQSLATLLVLAAPMAFAAPMACAQSASPAAPTAQSAPAPTPAPPPPGPHGWGSPRQGWYPGGPGFAHRDHGMGRWGSGDGLLPMGMWWKDPHMVAWLGLTADQQKKVSDMFLQSRLQLIHLHATLQEQQLMLEPLLNATPFDEAKAVVQIDKIADTRAELEKTNAKMLLDFRAVLTAEQWTRLRDRRFAHRPGPWDNGGAGAKGGGTGTH
ncbi:MAG: Spy/CpxP family protein refolding chaperone [Acidobacteriota bacterium]